MSSLSSLKCLGVIEKGPYQNFSGGINFASFIWDLLIQESEIKIQDPYFPMDYFPNLNKLSTEDGDLIYMIFFR